MFNPEDIAVLRSLAKGSKLALDVNFYHSESQPAHKCRMVPGDIAVPLHVHDRLLSLRAIKRGEITDIGRAAMLTYVAPNPRSAMPVPPPRKLAVA